MVEIQGLPEDNPLRCTTQNASSSRPKWLYLGIKYRTASQTTWSGSPANWIFMFNTRTVWSTVTFMSCQDSPNVLWNWSDRFKVHEGTVSSVSEIWITSNRWCRWKWSKSHEELLHLSWIITRTLRSPSSSFKTMTDSCWSNQCRSLLPFPIF